MPEVQPAVELRLAGCTAQHVGDRAEQQDRVSLITSPRAPRCALGVLADGVGGRSGGALAAEQVIATSTQRFEQFVPAEDAVDAFFASLVDEVHTVLHLAGATAGMEPHSTFAAILVQPHRVDWCHVGDSRVYHLRDGRMLHCTIDDTVAARRAPEAPRRPHAPPPNALIGALGASRRPRPNLGGLRDPRAGDTFLLCSDGLWNHLRPEELAEASDSRPPRLAAEHLIGLARARANGRGDNCSLVLLRFTSQAPAPVPASNPLPDAPAGGARVPAAALRAA